MQWETLGRALYQATRRLRRSPGFAAAAVVTLSLGIGANTAIFSVVDSVLLKPLPYPASSRLVAFSMNDRGQTETAFTLPQFQFLRAHVHTTGSMAGYRDVRATEVGHDGEIAWANGLAVTDGFFRVLGVSPWIGRAIEPADTKPGSMPAVVLSYGFWQTDFGGGAEVLGKQITLDGKPAIVVGITPKGFTFQEQPADFYQALPFDQSLLSHGRNTAAIARLRPGVSLQEARAEMKVLSNSMLALLPSWAKGVDVSNYQSLQASSTSTTLLLLLGAVELLLLIACANVASLVLARALARRPEIVVRRALGASNRDLFSQFFAEGTVLAALGAAAGLALAQLAAHVLVAQLPWDIPLAEPIGLDWRVLGFALAAGLAASVVFSLASMSQARGAAITPGRYEKPSRARDCIVVGEVALALVLLVGAGLLVRSLSNMLRQPLGFNPQGAVVFHTQLPAGSAPSVGAALRFDQQVTQTIAARPGTVIAATSMPPLAGHNNLPSQPAGQPGRSASVEVRAVSPNFFQTLGIPVLAGRGFSSSDISTAPMVAAVDEKLAKQWFGGREALGRQLRLGVWQTTVLVAALHLQSGSDRPRTVVGIVGEVKADALAQPALATIYVPMSQFASAGTWWVVRGGGWSEAGLRLAVRQVNTGVRITGMEHYPALIAHTLARPSFEAWLMGAFALLALVLTAVGLYGLLAYMVARRSKEIGVRVALGATPGRVVREFAWQGLRLAGFGLALGLAATVPLTKLMTGILYGVQPTNVLNLLSGAGLLGMVALAACMQPALRAARVDPASVLRQD